MASYPTKSRKSSSQPSTTPLPVETPHGRRFAAIVDGHTLRRSGRGVWSRPGEPLAWAFHESILSRAAELGVEWVEVVDRARGRCYRAPLTRVLAARAVEVEGWGVQRVLSFDAWEIVDLPPSSRGSPNQTMLALEGAGP